MDRFIIGGKNNGDVKTTEACLSSSTGSGSVTW